MMFAQLLSALMSEHHRVAWLRTRAQMEAMRAEAERNRQRPAYDLDLTATEIEPPQAIKDLRQP